MRQTSTETSQRYIDCLELFLKHGGRNVSRIEREMRALGHQFSRRILYNRSENGTHRPGWIARYGWKQMLDGRTGGNAGRGECAPPPPRPHGMAPNTAARHKSSPPSQGGVAASSADGVGTPGRLPSGRSWTADQHSRPDRSAHVSTTLADTPRHTTPRIPHFRAWLKRVSPNLRWDLPHLQYLYAHLKKISDGSCKRLMIFMPPRHGKSETVTVRYTAWRLSQDPSMNVILGSYNQRLADRFSRKVRRVLADDVSMTLKDRKGDQPESETSTVAGGTSRPKSVCPECHCHKTAQRAAKRDTSHSCTHDQNLLPFTQRQANSVSEWETAQGGTFRAVGVGSGVTGFGASLIVVDDPVKSRAEAESETYRDKVWDWFNDDLYTRLEPDGAIILIQTRWHEDDLAGRLLKEMNEGGEHWDVVNLPALCEEPDVQRNAQEQIATQSSPPYEGGVAASSPTGWFSQPQSTGHLMPDPHTATQRSQEGGFTPAPSYPPRLSVSAVQPTYDPIGRLPGEALWPSRYDEAALEKLRRKLGSYSFSSLYQQRPVPAEGGLFKISWFKNIVFAPPPGLKWHRGYDLAVSTKTTACYTASAKCAFDKEGNLYIADVMRKRMEFPEQRRYIYERVAIEKDTEHGVELALHGHAIIQDLRRAPQLRGRPFRGVKVDADKITRALGWASLAEDGKVFLVRGPWNQEFLNEVREFPSGKYDDQIDAVSIAVRMARHHKARSFWSF